MRTINRVFIISSIFIHVAAFSNNFLEEQRNYIKCRTVLSASVNSNEPSYSISETTRPVIKNWESWWHEMLHTANINKERNRKKLLTIYGTKKDYIVGTIIRCAARSYRGDASTPSSVAYTTRKDNMPQISVSTSGVIGDYNHYRTVALSSTHDRAVSILTDDVHKILNNMIQPGDLGENILVSGVAYDFFKVGSRYSIRNDSGGRSFNQEVILEITEAIVPCMNLCKLSSINNMDIVPEARVSRCQSFLEKLAMDDGIRGWYAKVIGSGTIYLGDKIELALA
eukprot:CAMPEP_0113315462 /NCGR_PEP_ID=MMETSP0010_2-20120614/11120_1 /TAXON_ID=216773 ORGANISM="Corethron hystrix, Strain 308" /NCGR_SAMPLE_ID=MMETSP0010_2 /ASSEMBLY_ACC=CAM_ASM_000155 /LENGTH=282 /DNA_ID=CAMNT_0000171967 /DNA_START=45 /DNA_END=893 /DNA_ORIENTATION=+ /assembly_acc=CAM_ASM_000155